MTDLEITRLCAEAMGVPLDKCSQKRWDQSSSVYGEEIHRSGFFQEEYRPLNDDAQAMALVRKFHLEPRWGMTREAWLVTPSYEDCPYSWSVDLNRAICECVAKMQAAK